MTPSLLSAASAKALSGTPSAAAGAATGSMVAAAREVATQNVIRVDDSIYSLVAVGLALIGIYLARQVTIDGENKRLRQRQTFRETWVLTAIAGLIVAPTIWHYDVPIAYSAWVGLGVGYSVRAVLAILGGTAQAIAKAMAQKVVESLNDGAVPLMPSAGYDADQAVLLDQLDKEEGADVPRIEDQREA